MMDQDTEYTLHTASQIPSDLEIACDRAVPEEQRRAAWIRHETKAWLEASKEGLRPANLDPRMLDVIRPSLVKAGICTRETLAQ